MLGVTFLSAILIGAALGAVPALAGIIVAVVTAVRRKQFSHLAIYVLFALSAELLLYLLAFLIFDCAGGTPMSDSEDLRSCFSMYIYFGASPGIALLAALPILFIKRFRKSDSESGSSRE